MRADACRCWPRRVAVTLRHGARSHPNVTRNSEVLCLECGRIWRSSAAYVDRAPDAPAGWEYATLQQIKEALNA